MEKTLKNSISISIHPPLIPIANFCTNIHRQAFPYLELLSKTKGPLKPGI